MQRIGIINWKLLKIFSYSQKRLMPNDLGFNVNDHIIRDYIFNIQKPVSDGAPSARFS